MTSADDTPAEYAPGRAPLKLAPMEVPKASDVLANELRERILNGEFAEGMALPPERELVAQTRMSRATVREALRILQVQGLGRIKASRGGGPLRAAAGPGRGRQVRQPADPRSAGPAGRPARNARGDRAV